MNAPAPNHLPWPTDIDPRVEALVTEVIGRVADKWTMLILDVLAEQGELRFTQIGREVPGISQKMLTQTLRSLERDGLVTRTVVPTVPVTVTYELTDLGRSLYATVRDLKIWAQQHMDEVAAHRERYDRDTAGE